MSSEKSACEAASARSVSASPCTSVVTALARTVWASLRSGLAAISTSSAAISSWERNVKKRNSRPTSSSGLRTKYW